MTQEMAPLRRELARLSTRQPGCRALRRAHYGIGGLLSVAVLAGRVGVLVAWAWVGLHFFAR